MLYAANITIGANLITVSADDKDGCLRGVALYRAEPKVKSRVLVAKSNGPQEEVDCTLRQEELTQRTTPINQLLPTHTKLQLFLSLCDIFITK